MNELKKYSCRIEDFEESKTPEGLDTKRFKLYCEEMFGTTAYASLSLLNYDEDSKTSYEDEEYAAVRQKQLEEFYGIPYDELSTIVGKEFEYFFNPKNGKFTMKEPKDFIKYDDMKEPFYEGEITNAYEIEREKLVIQMKIGEKYFNIHGMKFTQKNKDTKVDEFMIDKYIARYNTLNEKWKQSDLDDGEDFTKDNLDKLIGLTATVVKNKAGTTTYYALEKLA